MAKRPEGEVFNLWSSIEIGWGQLLFQFQPQRATPLRISDWLFLQLQESLTALPVGAEAVVSIQSPGLRDVRFTHVAGAPIPMGRLG